MNNRAVSNTQAVSDSRKGLLIAIAAALVLVALAAYRVPLFHDDLRGVILGVSEMRDEAGVKLAAAVRLENGAQVIVSIPGDFLIHKKTVVRVQEGRSLFGRKSYHFTGYDE